MSIATDSTKVSITRGAVGVHISAKHEVVPKLLEALDKSKLANDELIKSVRSRLAALTKEQK